MISACTAPFASRSASCSSSPLSSSISSITWLVDRGVRRKYEGLVFSRSGRGNDVIGVGHRAFDQAIRQALESPVTMAAIRELPCPTVVFQIFDQVTEHAGALQNSAVELDRALDLGFCYPPLENRDFNTICVHEESIVLAIPDTHPMQSMSTNVNIGSFLIALTAFASTMAVRPVLLVPVFSLFFHKHSRGGLGAADAARSTKGPSFFARIPATSSASRPHAPRNASGGQGHPRRGTIARRRAP